MRKNYPYPRNQARLAGFTLIELLVTITIAAILAAIALPSYRSFILGQRVKTTTTDLYSALIIARSESMKRNANVSLNQATGGWSKGWTVTLADTTVVQRQAIPDNVTVSERNGFTAVSYTWTGRPVTTSPLASFVVSATGIQPRCISLSLSGMPQTKVDTDKNPSNGC